MAIIVDRETVLSVYKETEIDAIITKKSWPDTWKALGENLKIIPAIELIQCKNCRDYWTRCLWSREMGPEGFCARGKLP